MAAARQFQQIFPEKFTCPIIHPLENKFTFNFLERRGVNMTLMNVVADYFSKDTHYCPALFQDIMRSPPWLKYQMRRLFLLNCLREKNETLAEDILRSFDDSDLKLSDFIISTKVEEHLCDPQEDHFSNIYRDSYSSALLFISRVFIKMAYGNQLKTLRNLCLGDLPFMSEEDSRELFDLQKYFQLSYVFKNYKKRETLGDNVVNNSYKIKINIDCGILKISQRLDYFQRANVVEIVVEYLRTTYRVDERIMLMCPLHPTKGFHLSLAYDYKLLPVYIDAHLSSVSFIRLNLQLNWLHIERLLHRLKCLNSLSLEDVALRNGLSEVLEGLSPLSSLRLCNVRLTSHDLNYIAESRHSLSLKHLCISNFNVLDMAEGITSFGHLLQSMKNNLETLEIIEIGLNAVNSRSLIGFFKQMKLQRVNVFGNEISMELFRSITRLSSMRLLILQSNGGHSESYLIYTAVTRNRNMKVSFEVFSLFKHL